MPPKFKLGDIVKCRVERGTHMWEWTGEVLSVRDVGYFDNQGWEYHVSNGPLVISVHPLLIWEFEGTLIEN